MPIYLGNTCNRLASYRKAAANPKNTYADASHWRHYKRNIWGYTISNARGDKGQIFSDTVDQYGDYIGDADKIITRLGHSGWYADNFQDETIVGGVCRMRTSRGTYYIPVTHRTESDGTVHWVNDAEIVPRGSNEEAHDAAANEAARSADHYAESEADDSREWCAKESAQYDIATARETIHETNVTALQLLKEIKATGKDFTPSICSALRSQLHAMLQTRAEQFKIIEERTENFWSAVPN